MNKPAMEVCSVESNPLVTEDVNIQGSDVRFTALLDSGASNNFVRRDVLRTLGITLEDKSPNAPRLTVILADGSRIETRLQSVTLCVEIGEHTMNETFIVMNLSSRYDLVLGIPWFVAHKPEIDWVNRSLLSLDGQEVHPGVSSQSRTAASPASVPPLAGMQAEENDLTCSETEALRTAIRDNEREPGRPRCVPARSPVKECTEVHDGPSDQPVTITERRSGDVPCVPHPTKVLDVKQSESARIGEAQEELGDPTATVNVAVVGRIGLGRQSVTLVNPPSSSSAIVSLPEMTQEEFLSALTGEEVEQVCWVVQQPNERVDTASAMLSLFHAAEQPSASMTKMDRVESQGWDSLKANPFYELLREFEDIFPEEVPPELPHDKGIRHEIDLVPGTKYCVTRQWPLPPEQVEAIDNFFAARHKAGQVRESKSPHSSPTFCVRKATGGWRIVHAFNKLNDATVPAQTPIPRKDMIIDGMQGSTIYSTLDLRDGFYQILMRPEDVPLTAVSTPSGMLWEWLVMPQGLKNAPATFNRCVTHLLRPVRAFAPSYFDDVYIHSRAVDGKTDVDVHRGHLRALFELMRRHKLYANLKKCLFGVSEIPVLGDLVGIRGVRPDPAKIKAVVEWPKPLNVKDLRKFLGLAAYLHKYSKNYAGLARPLSQLLRKEAEWQWTAECQQAFDELKRSLVEAPILKIADHKQPFHVVCDASDFAIGSALMQFDDDGKERVIAYVSRQLKPAERNYPVHDKELLSMKYALAKFRVYLLGTRPFVVYTDHASLRTAIKSPHLSQRMARWLSFFADYNFTVLYKPGKMNILADALSRRPDYESPGSEPVAMSLIATVPSSTLLADIKSAYNADPKWSALIDFLAEPSAKKKAQLDPEQRSRIHRYMLDDGVVYFHTAEDDNWRVVVPDDRDLRLQIMYECHDVPTSGHLGREKTYLALSRDFYWPNQYKWVRKYIRTCEICLRYQSLRTAGAVCRWISSSDSRRRSQRPVCWSLLIASARWSILLQFLKA